MVSRTTRHLRLILSCKFCPARLRGGLASCALAGGGFHNKEKKTLYPEYRKVREDMKELLTAKANIDRFLNYDEYREILAESKEKEAEQR